MKAYRQGNVESAKFGAAAGILSSTVVGKVMGETTKLSKSYFTFVILGVTSPTFISFPGVAI